MRRVRVTTLVVEKSITITYSECVPAALLIQRAMRMRRIILSPVTCPALPYLSYTVTQTARFLVKSH